MSFLEDLGVQGMPTISLTGFFSSTWLYIFIIAIIGLLLVTIAGVLFFFMTYKKKIVFFENIAGRGYQPLLKTRARVIKLGIGGEEILKTLVGGYFLSAYGRKMGHNTYWYAKGSDGYFYNFVLGDLDTKQGMLDIEPIDRDMRLLHVALDRLSHQTYGKNSFLEKYAIHMLLFAFLVILILGMWFIVGKIGEATAPLKQDNEMRLKIQEANDKTIQKLDSLIRSLGYLPDSFEGGSGLVPAT